jgi:uncharacterized protein (DUF4415 family)
MAKKRYTVRRTADALDKLTWRKGTRSNWAKAAKLTRRQIEAAVASDPDEAGMVMHWANASIEMPKSKAVLNMRVDRDVLDYFRRQGRGYQTKINAVLRSYVEQASRRRA